MCALKKVDTWVDLELVSIFVLNGIHAFKHLHFLILAINSLPLNVDCVKN